MIDVADMLEGVIGGTGRGDDGDDSVSAASVDDQKFRDE